MPRFAGAGASLAACGVFLLVACGTPTQDVERTILELEDSRTADLAPLVEQLSNPDERVQRLAVRAIGRIERLEHAEAVLALAASPSSDVRREAANALGQMRAAADLSSWVAREPDATVRAALFHTIGRVAPIDDVTETALVAGLADDDPRARLGAAHGLEAYVRLNARTRKPAPETVTALRRAVSDHPEAELRELALLALGAAGDRDRDTLVLSLTDGEPQVRRLAVIGLREWVDDPSPMVRYEALRVAPTCERAIASLGDESGHVVLLAVDLLGTLPCPAQSIEPLLAADRPWRVRAHAIVSLTRVSPVAARRHLPSAAADPVWQARVYAARAAKLAGAEDVRAALAADADPNVVIEAMTLPSEAVRALESNHRGLLMAAARGLEGSPALAGAVPRLLAAFVRLSRDDRPTSRDARLALLERLSEALTKEGARASALDALRPSLADRDPVVAARVAALMSGLTGGPVEPLTTRYADEAVPDAAFIAGLRRASAVVTMRNLGAFTIELLTDEAPATVGVFARHAEAGGYDGTTFHRVVPNFVLQGGSHGANEYDGAVGPFMRDELGLVRHLRGTLGISTRGRDTGDGQIFVNLVDNFRLDHQYTVWARVVDGMDVVDRILEGDVIEGIRILR